MLEETASTTDLFEIIKTTRSMRRLKPDPVPNELIRKILEAGVCAPSGGNMQRWRFLLIRDPKVKETIGAYTNGLGTSRWPHGIGLVNRPRAPAGSGLRGCSRRRNISPHIFMRPRSGLSLALKAALRPVRRARRFIQRCRTCCSPREPSASGRL